MRKTNFMSNNATIKPEISAAKATAILPKVTNPQPSPVKRIKEWWKNHFGTPQARKATAKSIAISIDSAIRSFAVAMRTNLLIALVAMLVVELCPGFSDTCPVFFQLCEGILIFYEFLLRATFTALKALIQTITLNLPGAGDSMSAIFTEAGRLISELITWIQAITF